MVQNEIDESEGGKERERERERSVVEHRWQPRSTTATRDQRGRSGDDDLKVSGK